MKSKLIETKQLTDLKFLNMFQSTFLMENGNTKTYYFASRRSLDQLGSKNKNHIDAIKVLPYFKRNDRFFVVLNYEFRSPLNAYTYDLCAGLVESQDDLESDVKREIFEEVGAEVKSIECVLKSGHTTAGLTDENISCYFAEIGDIGAQHLEEDEDISTKIIALDDIPEFLDNNQVGATGNLLLQVFYYKHIFSSKQD